MIVKTWIDEREAPLVEEIGNSIELIGLIERIGNSRIKRMELTETKMGQESKENPQSISYQGE